nr:MAG TPA: hypothetical protein [Bacteriophage sp.]
MFGLKIRANKRETDINPASLTCCNMFFIYNSRNHFSFC